MCFPMLKKLRLDHSLTQKTIADVLGIPQSAYSRYETGAGTITIEYLIQLSDFYGTTIDEIVRN